MNILEKYQTTGIFKAFKRNVKTGKIKNLKSDCYFKNLRPNIYLNHLANLGSGGSAPTSFEFNYTAISTKDVSLGASDGTLSSSTLELARVAPDSVTTTNGTTVITTTIPDGTGTTATAAISTVTSQTEFILDDASDFREGDRIQVPGQIASRRIETISTNTITINAAFPATVTTSDTIEQLITHVLITYDGSSTLNTGYAASIGQLEETKAADEELIFIHQLGYV